MSNSDIPKKYELSWFKVPDEVKKVAQHYLDVRKTLPKSDRGAFTPKDAAEYNASQAKLGKVTSLGSGHQRAVTLVNDEYVKEKTLRRMKAFFDRHSVYKKEGYHTYKKVTKKVRNKKTETLEDVELQVPSKSLQSWWSWGGDPGYEWAKSTVAKMNSVNEKEESEKRSNNKKSTVSEHIERLVTRYFHGDTPSLQETQTLLQKISKIQN